MTFKRDLILSPLRANLARPAHVLQMITGPRQVGKTTAIHQFLEEWPEPKLYATNDEAGIMHNGEIRPREERLARGVEGS